MISAKSQRSITQPGGERRANLACCYAHRGFHGMPGVPENSMAAFRHAAERGYASELDVHLLADGSLAVFHDEKLGRMTGALGMIEDYDKTNLAKLRLAGTEERIPMLDEVLDLYEDTDLPLLIELKAARGNHRELAEAVCRRLDSYRGDFVIESFDPRALLAVKRLRPDIIRGQLVQNFLKHDEGLPVYQAVMLTVLAMNAVVRPDFIAYRFSDGRGLALRHAAWRGLPLAAWTIRNPENYRMAVLEGCVPIFEGFDPDRDQSPAS